ncbi:MAG: 1-deoxy-D-xylulose-5-phosphate reductoisomerase [Alicyclobacillus sp.]|nr:1-deoxy-D-xylulose-5-phosphate reductoisomerase [Alicyclobacillus sp.]
MNTTVTILGSTGVIGRLTLDVIHHFSERYEVAALTAGRNMALFAEQIRVFRPRFVAVQDDEARQQLLALLGSDVQGLEVGVGEEGLVNAAALPSDIVVTAVVGARGLRPTWAALARGARIGLANKETLVAAGDLVMPFAASTGATIVPVDSEHAALFQCLLAGRREEVNRYLVTASGGPFRTYSPEAMAGITLEQALRHPTWTMGKKITIDSATLMNKGLEVIEAHHLFDAPYDKIDVLVHPQSVVHSMVEYQDGSVIAQLGSTDMRIPIQYALSFPERLISPWPAIDFLRLSSLTFEAPDLTRFPCLALAYEAGRVGGYAPCVLNAANEVAVAAFMEGRLPFIGIPEVIETVLSRYPAGTPSSVEDIVHMDAWARHAAQTTLEKGGWM